MSIEFPLIGISKSRKRIRTLLFISIPILIVLQFILHESGFTILGWIATGALGLMLITSFIVIRVYSKYEIIGNLKLNESSIIINGKKHNLEIIEEIVVKYKSYEGEPSRITLMGYYEGEDNLIKIQLKNEEGYFHYFRSELKNDFIHLSQYLNKYAAAGIKVNLIKLR